MGRQHVLPAARSNIKTLQVLARCRPGSLPCQLLMRGRPKSDWIYVFLQTQGSSHSCAHNQMAAMCKAWALCVATSL
jgi:hypothetical protein